jgi:hypothetical protein
MSVTVGLVRHRLEYLSIYCRTSQVIHRPVQISIYDKVHSKAIS